eukprot:294425-Pyramimonas_sp.AAC.1
MSDSAVVTRRLEECAQSHAEVSSGALVTQLDNKYAMRLKDTASTGMLLGEVATWQCLLKEMPACIGVKCKHEASCKKCIYGLMWLKMVGELIRRQWASGRP